MCVYTNIHICVYIYICVCTHDNICMRTGVYARVCEYVLVHMWCYVVCARVSICAYVMCCDEMWRMYLTCICMYSCMSACIAACTPMYARVCMHACMYACTRARMHTHTHTYIYIYIYHIHHIHTYTHANISTYLHICIYHIKISEAHRVRTCIDFLTDSCSKHVQTRGWQETKHEHHQWKPITEERPHSASPSNIDDMRVQ